MSATSERERRPSGRAGIWTAGCCIAVAGLVAAVYWPTTRYGFTNYDDPDYVTANRALRQPGLRGLWAVVSRPMPASHGDYLPVTMVSYWLDYRWWQLEAGGYHLSNLAVHAASAGLICWLLLRLGGALWVAVVAGLLFGLHPMNTEAVSWVSERKSVLSMFWLLLSMHSFITWRGRAGLGWYVAAVVLYLLACLSKTAVVFYPLLLLGEQIYLRRWRLRRAVVWTVPFAVVAGLCAAGRLIGHAYSGQLGWRPFGGLAEQAINVVGFFGMYLAKLCWPAGLNCSYPLRVLESVFSGWVLLGGAALVVLVVVAVRAYGRWPLVGFLCVWYLAGWLPHAQIVPIPPGLRADRYVYFSCAAAFALAAMAVGHVFGRVVGGRRVMGRAVGAGVLAVVIAAAGAGTVVRNRVWADSYALWSDSLAKDYDNPLAHNNMGVALKDRGLLDRAERHFREAIRLDPRHADARFNLADVLAARKQYAQAIGYYREAISIDPDQPAYRINLANALRSIGRLDEAIAEYRQAIRLDPEVPGIYRNLGDVLVLAGYYEQAVEALRQVIAKKPDDWLACNNLAWLLATCPDEGVRDGQQAVVLAKRARRLRGPNDPQTLDTLAAAYAEAGQFERAIETQVRAVRLAAAEKKDLYLRRLGLYRAGRAVRMAAPGR